MIRQRFLFCLASLALVSSLTSVQAQDQLSIPNGADAVWRQIQKRDAAVAQGTISYLQSRGDKSQWVRVLLEYRSDFRFRRKEENDGKISSGLTLPETVYDGVDWFNISPSTVIISRGKPQELQLGMHTIDVTPKPSFPAGRGLSLLKNHSITLKRNWATVKGEAEDGSRVSADVDLRHSFLARKITRSNKAGRLIGVIMTKGELVNGAIAASAAYSGPRVKGAWKFLKADFSSPAVARFKVALTAGPMIVDERMGEPIGIRKTTLGSMDKDEVLRRTKAELDKRARLMAFLQKRQSIQNAINAFLLLLPILLFGVWFSSRRGNVSSKVSE